MMKKYLKKTFEKYKSKNKFKLNNTYLKLFSNIDKKTTRPFNLQNIKNLKTAAFSYPLF